MFVYILTLAIILLSVYNVDIKKNKKVSNLFFYTELVIMILITGFQWRLGGDNLSYEIYYKDIPTIDRLDINQMDIGVKYQPLWYIFCSLLKSITPSFVFFHIVHSIIINTTVLFFFKKYTKYVFTAILLYYLSFNYLMFNIELQRESMAVMCFLLGIKYLQNRSTKGYDKYYLLAIAAFLFHTSAIITFVIPIFVWFLSRAKSLVTTTLILGAMILLFIYASENLMLSYNGNGIGGKIYAQAEHYYEIKKNFTNVLIIGLFNTLPALIVVILFFSNKNRSDIFIYLSMMLVVVYIGNAYFTGLYRMVNYLIFPFYVCLVDVFYSTHRYRLLKVFCVLVMIVSTTYQMTRPIDFRRPGDLYYNMYIPYNSVFDDGQNLFN